VLQDLDQDIVQSWIDAMSQGAAQAAILCIQGQKSIGWAALSDEDGNRCGLVLVVLGGELANEVVCNLESVHGAAVSASMVES